MEILLYLSLSAVMVALIGGIGVNVLSGLTGAKAEEDLQYNAQFVFEKIRPLVTAAGSIEIPRTGATSSSLVLRSEDLAKDPTVIDVVNGRIRVQKGNAEAQLLSGRNTVVSDLVFSNVTYEDGPGSVQIVMPIGMVNQGGGGGPGVSTTLQTTINLRYP